MSEDERNEIIAAIDELLDRRAAQEGLREKIADALRAWIDDSLEDIRESRGYGNPLAMADRIIALLKEGK